jgi:hypothetical protein
MEAKADNADLVSVTHRTAEKMFGLSLAIGINPGRALIDRLRAGVLGHSIAGNHPNFPVRTPKAVRWAFPRFYHISDIYCVINRKNAQK